MKKNNNEKIFSFFYRPFFCLPQKSKKFRKIFLKKIPKIDLKFVAE
jgi:hypothetical protein